MTNALVLFSGGQDSTVCLASALSRFDRVTTVGFDYGQRHRIELDCRPRVLEAMRVGFPDWSAKLGEDLLIPIPAFGAIGGSAMTDEIAIETAASGLPNTFVPARNLVFLTLASGLAYRQGASVLVGGMCQTDYSGYPDCRRETLDAQEQALALGLEKPMRIDTPLMDLTKAQSWALSKGLGGNALVSLIVEETHTCYVGDRTQRHDWGYGCGNCPACDLRARGWNDWKNAGQPTVDIAMSS